MTVVRCLDRALATEAEFCKREEAHDVTTAGCNELTDNLRGGGMLNHDAGVGRARSSTWSNCATSAFSRGSKALSDDAGAPPAPASEDKSRERNT